MTSHPSVNCVIQDNIHLRLLFLNESAVVKNTMQSYCNISDCYMIFFKSHAEINEWFPWVGFESRDFSCSPSTSHSNPFFLACIDFCDAQSVSWMDAGEKWDVSGGFTLQRSALKVIAGRKGTLRCSALMIHLISLPLWPHWGFVGLFSSWGKNVTLWYYKCYLRLPQKLMFSPVNDVIDFITMFTT